MYVLEVRNAELIESLTRQAAELGITNAAIVALIGAIDSFTVSTNPAGDATAHTYSSYPLPAEMTATGEIVGGKPHIHAVMAVQGDRTIGGHLHKAHLHTSFARAYVIPSEHHVDVPPHEQIVFEQPADEGPTSRGRISDTRVAPRPTQTRIEALSKHFPAKELQTTTSKKQLNKAITSKGIIMTSTHQTHQRSLPASTSTRSSAL